GGGETIDVAGDWIGDVYGTNIGNAYVRFEQDGAQLTGEAKFNDRQLGTTNYSVTGTVGERIEFTMVPTFVPETIEASVVTGSLEVGMDGKLYGRWSSTGQGTGGVLTLSRYLMPSQIKGAPPEQSATAPTRIYNSSRDIGAVRLGREDLRRLVTVVQRDFTLGRAVVNYTPKGGSQRTEYATSLLADLSITDTLESVTVSVQEAEANSINRGVTLELAAVSGSSVRTYGSIESWVVGKAATVAAEVSLHERALATSYKRRGLGFNGVILLIAVAFLPVDQSGWLRLGYLLGVAGILSMLNFVHARLIPMTIVQLGPTMPGFWSRFGAPVLSWLLAISSAVLIKVLSDVFSGSSVIAQFVEWVFRTLGIESPPSG
ncbi:MAG TPA: hypothetical protein PKH39_19450, partial [Woeseiaceae bacterium]|nr:hypothetical protein [Woeseiaceae bacterium]